MLLTYIPNLSIGAGGTGKSAVVHALSREFKRLGLGRVLVTAYTGVAAAPFGGPTLLKLLNLNLNTKLNAKVAENDPKDREKKCQKFKDECGAPIEEFGCVVIDEISFIDAVVLGHVDKGFANLLGNSELCGGLPFLLCGDNHQKPPPGGTPWYQYMVKLAAKEETATIALGTDSANHRGITLLSAAKRIELHRLMRARDDPDFIAIQLQMRKTEMLHPVPDDLLKQLHTVTLDDMASDPAWRFAPIGVLTHIERDALNLEQLKAFAKAFNLPIFRWRCFLVDGELLQADVRNELYDHEPNLWSYFVEGAPVLQLTNISSVRQLVNGAPCLLDSLTITNEDDREAIEIAYQVGYSEDFVTLKCTPLAVNVVVGGTKEHPVLWHEVYISTLFTRS